MVVKPGNQSKIWFITSDAFPAIGSNFASLLQQLEAVTAPNVSGPIAFAIEGAIAGARHVGWRAETKGPLIPRSWQEVKWEHRDVLEKMSVLPNKLYDPEALQTPGVLDVILPSIWREPADSENLEYVVRGGGHYARFLCPKNWYYHEGCTQVSFILTLTESDTSNEHPLPDPEKVPQFAVQTIYIGNYVRIGENAEDVARQIFEKHIKPREPKEGEKIIPRLEKKLIRTFEQSEQFECQRIGAEIEGYETRRFDWIFWKKETGDLVRVWASAPKEQWNTYAPIFEKMAASIGAHKNNENVAPRGKDGTPYRL